MMSTKPLLTVFILFLLSCSGDATKDHAPAAIERSVEVVSIASGSPVTIADLSIDGMSCEMMCGGSIKKALAALPGVSSTRIDFEEGEERDHAIVTYDEAQVSDADMIAAVEKLYDGQYKVVAVKVTKQVPAADANDDEAEGSDPAKVNVMAPAAIALPGILSLITHLFRL